MTKNSTTAGPPSTSGRTNCFLGCFGYSGQKMNHADEVNSGSRRRRWISKWSFSCKKSAAKTVPVDITTTPRKSKSVYDAPATSDTTWEIQVVEDEAALTKKHVVMMEDPVKSDEQKTRRKKWADAVKRQNGSYRSRRKETKAAAVKASSAGLDSVGKKTVTINSLVSSPLKPLTHSTSLPAPKRMKPPRASPAADGVEGGVPQKTTLSGGEFDSIMGMSVILVILVIIMLWGKLCAILCTSAWFFVAPRLGAAEESSTVATAEKGRPESLNNMDLESVEYKKKVVLEGLLQRNHRNVVGRL